MPQALMANRIAVSYSTPNGRTIASTDVDKESCCVCSGGGPFEPPLDPPSTPLCNCFARPPFNLCEYGKTPCLIPTATTFPPPVGRKFDLRIEGESAIQSSYYNDFMRLHGITPKSHSFTHTYSDSRLFSTRWCGGGMGLSKLVAPDPPPGFTGITWQEGSTLQITINTCKSFDPRDPFRSAVRRVYEPPDPNPGFATSAIPTARKIRAIATFNASSRLLFRLFDNGRMTFSQGMTMYNLTGAYDVTTQESLWQLEYMPVSGGFSVAFGVLPVCCGTWKATANVTPITGHGVCSPGLAFNVFAAWNVESQPGGRAGGFGIWDEGSISASGFVKLNLRECEDQGPDDSRECATCDGLKEGVLL